MQDLSAEFLFSISSLCWSVLGAAVVGFFVCNVSTDCAMICGRGLCLPPIWHPVLSRDKRTLSW